MIHGRFEMVGILFVNFLIEALKCSFVFLFGLIVFLEKLVDHILLLIETAALYKIDRGFVLDRVFSWILFGLIEGGIGACFVGLAKKNTLIEKRRSFFFLINSFKLLLFFINTFLNFFN